MNLKLNLIISNWKCSGQGDSNFNEQGDLGAHDEYGNGNEEYVAEYEFGLIRNCPQQTLNQGKYFTKGKSIYLLYLWEMLK